MQLPLKSGLRILASCSPFLVACNARESLDYTSVATSQASTTVLTEFPARSLVRDIEIVGDFLAVLDAAERGAIYLIEPATGEIVSRATVPADSGGALAGAVNLESGSSETDALWLYDVRKRSVTQLELDSLLAGTVSGRSRALEAVGVPMEVRLINDSVFAAPGFFQTGRVALFGANGASVGRVGSVPGELADGPPEVRQQLYQAHLGVHPGGNKLVLANRHFGFLELYSTDDDASRIIPGPFSFEPRYEVAEVEGRPVLRTGSGLRFGYVDVAVTEQEILALFSGKTRAAAPGTASHGRYLHAFRWDGGFRVAIELEFPLVSITIDPATRTVYGLRRHPRPALVRIELPNEPDGADTLPASTFP